jgi:hypothetical protein
MIDINITHNSGHYTKKDSAIGNVQKCDSYINTPLSQTDIYIDVEDLTFSRLSAHRWR